MQCSNNALRSNVLRASAVPVQIQLTIILKRFRRCSPCDHCFFPPEKKPCFDMRNVTIERASTVHSRMIRSFMNTQYWPREPSVLGLWMSMSSPYLEVLTDRYSHSGERLLAFEKLPRTGEKKLIGITVANRVYPWMVDELVEWAHFTTSKPEKYRMFYCAHCLKSPDLFKKYKAEYIYNIEVLGTATEVSGQGVGKRLLEAALKSAEEMRHTVVQFVSGSHYASKICEKCGMKRVWKMDYTEFVDDSGLRVFYPRRPHHTVGVYVKYNDPKHGGEEPCKPPY
ncbi:unnamed protein product [Chrysodeixis includens]|uniref:N-acetyltransferase domain-containing protein n=1 Tax=Chrysodeixis includens TaxID=689277 RepID=A0A9N8KW98_CHRIL|nr:unnamed protein product [Chrysodeixis includens]